MQKLPAVSNLDAARAYFRRARETHPELCEWAYLLHQPGAGTCWTGIGAHRIVHYTGDRFEIHADGEKTARPAGTDIFRELRPLLDPSLPCFFLVSLDIRRAARDPSLPLMSFVQPKVEACFGDAAPALLAAAPGLEEAARDLIERDDTAPLPAICAKGNANASPWQGEDDAHFLERLKRAVETLQSVHGKMIITRTYHRPAPADADAFRLFEIYSDFEANAAACHYAALGGINSLGCSPENVFEMNGSELAFDVVASTRGISTDPEQDARWLNELLTDAKERKEHGMALERYQKRMERLCQAGSVRLERHMDVRTLRHVRHLFSRVSGTLKEGLDCFDMLHDSYPPLSSYPDELVPLADAGTEPTRYYGGMVGRIGPGWQDARCYLNLRAALVQDGEIHTQGGVGVIRESIPRQELLEVANKLRSLKEAVSAWENAKPN